jgi:hypothetical protein
MHRSQNVWHVHLEKCKKIFKYPLSCPTTSVDSQICRTFWEEKPWLLYRVESKLVLISKYNKTIDKVFTEEKKFINHTKCKWLSHTYIFLDSIIFKYIFSIKMMETIPDQLESCRYNVCVQKQLKFGMIKGVSFFTLRGH